jgi:hypothetical protein
VNITLSRTKAEYLEQVRSRLADIPADDLDDVVQDLETHLVELDDAEIEAELGAPAQFAREFRISAGLEGHDRPGRLKELRAAAKSFDGRIENGAKQLADLTRWRSIRPLWIWIRGWLLIGTWGVLYYEEPFRHFPVPSIGYSSLAGLVLVAIATGLSVWLDRAPATGRRRVGTRIFSVAAGVAVIASLLNPLPDPRTQFIDSVDYIDRLTTSGGRIVENIYAYDAAGNPVDVLLFDQDGEPLLTMPGWVYDESQFDNGQVLYGEGAVRFLQDDAGRIIPNLYPLQILRHDPMGALQPVPPPSFGFPNVTAPARGAQTSPPTTITSEEDLSP